MGAIRPSGGTGRPSVTPSAYLLVGVLLAAVGLASCAPGSRWPPPPMPFPPRPRQSLSGPSQLGLDVTPEDYVIDKLASFFQQVRRIQDDPRSQAQAPPQEEEEEDTEPYNDDGLSYDDESGSQQAATEGRGPGFSYRFPKTSPVSTFAVNPSNPRYYSASDAFRPEADSNAVETREAAGEEESEPSEMMEAPVLPPSGGRIPEVKPIIFSTDSEVAVPHMPGHNEHQESARQKSPRPPPPAPPVSTHHDSASHQAQVDGVQSEQVKRERPSKVPVVGKYYVYVTAIIAGCSAAGVVGLVAAGIFWYKLQRNAKAAADVEYPAYGVTGPNQEASAVAAAAAAATASTPPSGQPGGVGGSTSPLSAGDRRLAQSAQMYHYQHQKQQIIAMESRASNDRHGSVSEVDSEEENEEGDYTVYECPGLAPTGEMEVKNPLFHDDPTPATPSGGNRDQRDAGSKQ